MSTIREKVTNIFSNNENIVITNNYTEILSAYCDNNDITSTIKDIVKNKINENPIIIVNDDLFNNNISTNYKTIKISYMCDV
jgi:hypothetical protein